MTSITKSPTGSLTFVKSTSNKSLEFIIHNTDPSLCFSTFPHPFYETHHQFLRFNYSPERLEFGYFMDELSVQEGIGFISSGSRKCCWVDNPLKQSRFTQKWKQIFPAVIPSVNWKIRRSKLFMNTKFRIWKPIWIGGIKFVKGWQKIN